MEQTSLFERRVPQPLAARLRPATLDEYVGQTHLLGPGKVLRRLIETDQVSSMIFWGPPGVGKTTLARIIANCTKASFIDFSAVTSGIKEIRAVMQQAEDNRRFGERTILFVDEIHRFNKAQQDAFLPFVEKGSIILIGATTENPSFEINGALLSRCKVFVLHSLSPEELVTLLRRALKDPRGFGGQTVHITDEVLEALAVFANGDARTALSTLEMVVLNGDTGADGSVTVTEQTFEQCTSKKSLLYDKKGEEHYNLISALHKSMRNSDPDAAVYWLARMLEAGEDPLYVARRVIRFASEDVGLADPRALEQAVAAYQACHFLGMPECTVPSDAGCRVHVAGAEIERALRRLRARQKRCRQAVGRAGAACDPQCADPLDAGTGLRQGIPIRPRRAGQIDYDPMSARFSSGPGVLCPHRGRPGSALQGAVGTNQDLEKRA